MEYLTRIKLPPPPSGTERILIFGRGYLGERLARHFRDRAIWGATDIADMQEIQQDIEQYRPTVIINAAGKTNTNQIEKPEYRAEAYESNVRGAANVAYLARQYGIYAVQFSSGMMFDGEGPRGDGFREDDIPNPTCYYAWTKAWSDWQLYPFLHQDHLLIVRIHLPSSCEAHPRNYLTKLTRFSRFTTTPTSVTVVEDMLKALSVMIKQRATGIYHVVNPGKISAYDIAVLLKESGQLHSHQEISGLSRKELDQLTTENQGARQSFPVLNTDKLRELGIELPDIRTALTSCLPLRLEEDMQASSA
jgi:3,5-epimerase/4-reductase